MATFMLVRLYAYRNDQKYDLGEHATVETRNDGDGLLVIGHPGSYALLSSGDGVTWEDGEGHQYDRFETTTVGTDRNGGEG